MPGPAHPRVRALQRIALWAGLGGWIGALLLCGGVLVGAAFELIPDPQVAARVVGRVLAPLQVAGVALGVGLAALGGAMRRGRLAIALPLALAVACAVNQFGVAPAVAAIDLADPAAAPGAGLRFARLHQLSVGLFVGVGAGAVLLALWHGVLELREERPEGA